MSEHCQKHKYDLHWSDTTCPYCKIEHQQAQLRTLVEALENLMEWQVKNVRKWNNRAYDEAAAALKEVKGENTSTSS